MMMPKMLVVLALLAHGAVSVRSNTWLSEGRSLELEKMEKKPQFVENIFKKGRSLKGWIARKLGKKKVEVPLDPDKVEKEIEKKDIAEEIDEEKLVDDVQKRLNSELGIFATRHQVKEFIRNASPELGLMTWTQLLQPAGADELLRFAKVHLPLDVTASAVAFCSELVKRSESLTGYQGSEIIKRELRGAEEICPQVLTGNLSNMSNASKWAVEAAEVAEMDHQQHPYGRLDGVAWKHSLKRVCHDECEALVQGIQEKASLLAASVDFARNTIEDSCADEVVKHVEAEILGCCSRSCGWNGQFCSFFPFLSSEEQADWQAECCVERNILKFSTRQQMCDSTLSQADKNMSEKIVDKRPNKAKDRKILAQDESQNSKSWSLMERSFGGSVDNNTCPPPINLHKIYENFFQDWKRVPLNEASKVERRCKPKDQPSRGECKSFLLKETTDDEGGTQYNYNCWDACGLKQPKNPESLNVLAEKVKDEVLGIGGFLFVHKEIYSAWKWT